MDNCFSHKLDNKTLLFLCRDISAFLSSGFTIENALKDVASGYPEEFSKVLTEIADKILEGIPFSEALTHYPDYFKEQFIDFVKIGDTTGRYDRQFIEICRIIEKEESFKKSIDEILLQPKIIFLIGIALHMVNIIFLIPLSIYTTLEDGQTVSFSSQPISYLLLIPFKIFPVSIAACVFAVISAWKYCDTPPVRNKFIKLFKFVPQFRDAMESDSVSRFFYTLSYLFDTGIPADKSIELAGKTSGNVHIVEVTNRITLFIRNGSSVSEAFNRAYYFNSRVEATVSNAELAGNFTKAFEDMSKFCENEARHKLETAVMILQPILRFSTFGFVFFNIAIVAAISACFVPQI